MLNKTPCTPPDHLAADERSIYRQEMQGFSRVLASIEWLLVILVMLYVKLPGDFVQNENAVIAGLALQVGCILFFHYIWPSSSRVRWALLVEIGIMTAFITFVLWHTGKIQSPLLSLYFLVIIFTAIALDTGFTILKVALISGCYAFLAFNHGALADFSLSANMGSVMLLLSFWLVAYLATMLSRQTDISKQQIRHLSEIDYLTGLYNMRSFVALAKKEQKRAERQGYPFSIMMLDADNLKPVNDTYGHESGSNMIKHLAKDIRSNLRASDIAARFGGDEFVILLTEADAQSAVIAGERIRTTIENSPLNVPGGTVTVTVSVGIAGFPIHGATVEELVNRADNAMYASKRTGKNKTSVYDATHDPDSGHGPHEAAPGPGSA